MDVRLKALSDEAIDAAGGELSRLSSEIWSNPELNFEEKHANGILTSFLESKGMSMQRHYVVDTAFRAEVGGGVGDDGPNVAVLCEYDALPEIGHACGHNLIAEVGVGAAIGIKAALEAARKEGRDLGKLTVLGTPAEEGGGGKITLLEAGAFRDIDCSLMAHPAPVNFVDFRYVAITEVAVVYKGRAAHAAASPWDGVNALDAAVAAYSSVSCLRQQMKPDWRVHGIITNGGVKPNIIPEEAALLYYIRAPTVRERDLLEAKVYACFNAAAIATGCTVEIKCIQQYDNMIHNDAMVSVYRENMASYGVKEIPTDHIGRTQVASSDVGNVSQCVPSIAPLFDIGTDDGLHSRGFLKAAGADEAQAYTLTQAKLLAATAIDLYCRPQLIHTAKEQLEKHFREQLA